MNIDILGVAPFVVFSSVATWFGQAFVLRRQNRRDAIEQSDRLEVHRDGLTFELLQAARAEVAGARVEVEGLREETIKLRGLEAHFYHFEQALDHLDAILNASNADDRTAAERAARAFLNRMRRLNEARGTLRNEVQVAVSKIHLTGEDKAPGQEG